MKKRRTASLLLIALMLFGAFVVAAPAASAWEYTVYESVECSLDGAGEDVGETCSVTVGGSDP